MRRISLSSCSASNWNRTDWITSQLRAPDNPDSYLIDSGHKFRLHFNGFCMQIDYKVPIRLANNLFWFFLSIYLAVIANDTADLSKMFSRGRFGRCRLAELSWVWQMRDASCKFFHFILRQTTQTNKHFIFSQTNYEPQSIKSRPEFVSRPKHWSKAAIRWVHHCTNRVAKMRQRWSSAKRKRQMPPNRRPIWTQEPNWPIWSNARQKSR